ncbi:MAG: carbamoyl-phosphate synthase large subunit [Chloroflexota bacterium]
MPKRTDIQSILILGAGPIIIGQACEFDYSGVQACKVLKAEGYRVILINSNPATIMTDPEFADATYIEPLTVETVEMVLVEEKPDAILPTVGGQTALNLAVEIAEAGLLEKYQVQLIGASLEAMQLAEDRQRFKDTMTRIGLQTPRSVLTNNVEDAIELSKEVGYPMLVRASYTLGGTGSGIAYDEKGLIDAVEHGCHLSPVGEVLVEQSLLGWKEFELEVMRDKDDNFVVVCSIENLDAMGVHTGDSITVAPSQTLTDKEYQRLRDASKAILIEIGVETGGSNVQFAVNPANGELVVIEMNPRVSRSSALASKATGFPIAKMAALLAVGYTLPEIPNDITRETPASFEPTIDYVVVKIPRWAFEKFPGVDPTLTSQMKSVGEVMAIGRTFKEALGKGIRGLEMGVDGLWIPGLDYQLTDLQVPTRERLFQAYHALLDGHSIDEVSDLSAYDPWFVYQLSEMAQWQTYLTQFSLDTISADDLRQSKRYGFSDMALARLLSTSDDDEIAWQDVRSKRIEHEITPVYHRVDTCAAEFEAHTPYLYSTYETSCESHPTQNKKVMILGSGPNRIGQGIEFDYCCVHACFALNEAGYETIMVNCNPETVSTDYDTADRLYFEPLTLEDVLNIVDIEKPDGVFVQFGGQTPLNLAQDLARAGVPILGTSPDAIALAEDREQFEAILNKLDIPRPANGIAHDLAEATAIAAEIGYPVLVRPSFVLGGRAMAIVDNDSELAGYIDEAMKVADGQPILIDQFLEDAYEADVDALCDGTDVVIGGVMQHIEEAGIHSGDSACVLPPYKLSAYHLSIIEDYTTRLGLEIGVRGLMNIQYAVKDDVVYVIEVNPRASRTVPFVSKATGYPLAKLAAKIMAGHTLTEVEFIEQPQVDGFFVKEAVLPFQKFPGVDAVLSPEMRSTGEVMGHAARFGHAYLKAQSAASNKLPQSGTVFISVNDYDKGAAIKIGRDLIGLGFDVVATKGTAEALNRVGLAAREINKVKDGSPHIVESIQAGEIDLIVNTPMGGAARMDGKGIRVAATRLGLPILTTISAATAAVNGIRALRQKNLQVRSLQKHHQIG